MSVENAQTTNSAPVESKIETPAVEAPKVEATATITEAPKVEESKIEAKAETKQTEEKPVELALVLPEGSKVDKSTLDETLKLAKEKGWSQEYAQSYLDAKHTAIESFAKQQQDIMSDLNERTWKDELVADKEFGGSKFEENGILAHKAASKFFGQEFADELVSMKLNHHPKLFRGLVRIAQAMSDDVSVHSGPKSDDSNIPLEQKMYPTMFNK